MVLSIYVCRTVPQSNRLGSRGSTTLRILSSWKGTFLVGAFVFSIKIVMTVVLGQVFSHPFTLW